MEMKCMRSFRKFMMRVLAEILIRKKWKIGRKTGAEKRKWLGILPNKVASHFLRGDFV